MIDAAEICARLNREAMALCRELLPQGEQCGNSWMASGVWDMGKSRSMAVHLAGERQGHWTDFGGCAPGEERGDMMDLVRIRLCGGDAGAAFAEAKRRLGIDDMFTPGPRAQPDPAEQARRAEEARARAEAGEARQAAERERKAKSARALWLGEGARPIAGTPAEQYLRARGIDVGPGLDGTGGKWPGSLKFRDALRHRPSEGHYPALLAAGFNAAGQQRFCHRIWLSQQGGRWSKIAHEHAKMVLGPFWGSFVPISRGKADTPISRMAQGEAVYVTEGIEDALVVRMLRPELRVICAVSLGNIGAIVLPPQARQLVIVADRDDKVQAQDTLERAIAAQQARGLEVRLVMPPPGAKDVNDWLRGGAGAAGSAMRGAA